jgi:RNA polymerase-binding transcription factor DksA
MAAKKTSKAKASAKKKTAAKKTAVKKKAPAQKAAPKKTAKKKVTPKTAAKKPAEKTPPKKTAAKKTVKKAAPKKTTRKKKLVTRKKAEEVKPEEFKPLRKVKTPFKVRELRKFEKLLLELRERVLGERAYLLNDNLHHEKDTSLSDQGTDNFDQEFALNLASTEQDTLFEIEEALRRIENKTYGVCELSGEPIEIARLEALPHTRFSVKAQSELEKGRIHYRPFDGRGPKLSY